MKLKIRNRVLTLLLAIIICFTSTTVIAPAEASAASKYIKVSTYIKYILSTMRLPVNAGESYIDVAIKNDLLRKGDIKDYNAYLTRTDCAVLANRLEELVNYNYGYTDDIYEILSECEYYDNRFYYKVTGDLYPEGKTKDTYPADQFLEDVVMPRLYMFNIDFRAGYEYITDGDANILERYIELGLKPESETNFVGIDPIEESSYLVLAWTRIKDGDRKKAIVLEKRISDINKVAKSKRKAVAALFAKGIITGYSNGPYVQNREFRGENKITAAGAKEVIQKVMNLEKRSLISPDGQLIRTTKLPSNASDYAYILECFPNAFYEMRYGFMYYTGFKEGIVDKSIYNYPGETSYQFLYDKLYKSDMSLGIDTYEYYDKAISQAEQYLNAVFNMNYKTVDKKWIEKLASSYAPYGGDNIYEQIDDYLVAAKKNHVVTECKLISVEPSSMYYDNGSLFIRSYVKYRITADNINVDQDELLYGHYNDLQGLKNGYWTYGYYDIELRGTRYNENLSYLNWGVHAFARISDWELKGTY